jgi:hypothetical protein
MGGFDMEAANRMRDKRLRRRMLGVLNEARKAPRGGISGRVLVDVANASSPRGQRLETDDHAMGLIRDLVAGKYAAETPLQRRKHQEHGLDTMIVSITDFGAKLICEAVDPDPLIDDDRIPAGEDQ